jgi:hypothetical protein
MPSKVAIIEPSDFMAISVRAYVPELAEKLIPTRGRKKSKLRPSPYSVTFDTETTTDEKQTLRIGVYQVRKHSELTEVGVFYNSNLIVGPDLELLKSWTHSKNYTLMPVARFVDDILFGIGFDLRATIIGFNLPFDLSRIAIDHGAARGSFKGGFSFQLSKNEFRPRILIKHISAKASLIEFGFPVAMPEASGMRRRKLKIPKRAGYFVDVKTIAGALLSKSFSLEKLGGTLKTENRKSPSDEHDGPLTHTYLEYAVNDVQVTWECFEALRRRYDALNLNTLLHKIYSEASLGKAYLEEMGVLPFFSKQPDFPAVMTGQIMGSYFGGRSEAHLRREIHQVAYCDFKSMYPSVCILMKLWSFVTAKEIVWHDSTAATAQFLDQVSLEDLQQKDCWRKLHTVVKVLPDGDAFPIRGNYGLSPQATIGLNNVKSEIPLWYSLADCISAKLHSGKSVKIIEAISFEARGVQDGLKPIILAGNSDYLVNPAADDFYKAIIDLRNELLELLKFAVGARAEELKRDEHALKLLANSTSYGIFVEFIVSQLSKPELRTCFGIDETFQTSVTKNEKPGNYFNPLLASLITGGARLMLSITQALIEKSKLDWAMCDTDSMAIANIDNIPNEEFFSKVREICNWFNPLNPYAKKQSILKIENVNYGLKRSDTEISMTSLFALVISSKRYVLFNLVPDGSIIIRKASAHGLGQYVDPYSADESPLPAPVVSLEDMGVRRWQHDLWHQIIRAALDGNRDIVDLAGLPNLDRPAASRYGSTTPHLLNWFKTHNEGHSYEDRVKPANFLLSFQARDSSQDPTIADDSNFHDRTRPKPIAPYSKDIAEAASRCFDRETGQPVPISELKTYREALKDYHLSAESKFENGGSYDHGATRRRNLRVVAIDLIGKEADRWEDQAYLGIDPNSQINYGRLPGSNRHFAEYFRAALKVFGARKLERELNIPRSTVNNYASGNLGRISRSRVLHLLSDLGQLRSELIEDAHIEQQLIERSKAAIAKIGISEFARRINWNSSNLRKSLDGNRRICSRLVAHIRAYFAENIPSKDVPYSLAWRRGD